MQTNALLRRISTGAILVAIVALTACADRSAPTVSVETGGISGMAPIDGTRYLAVRDLKGFETGSRLRVIEIRPGRPYTVTDVADIDWSHPDGPASDLEAMCAIPDRASEYFLLESGHWEGRNGRLFHIRLNRDEDGYNARVVRVIELPEFDSKGPGDPGDEMEGLACGARGDDEVLLILGERGGSDPYPAGLLRWFAADLERQTESWTEAGRTGVIVDAPGEWSDPAKNRDISALHLRPDGSLWAAAADDLSDEGPFNSIVYRLGAVAPDEEMPIRLDEAFAIHDVVSGFKVEALTSGPSNISNSGFAIGTEDESFGGTWRPLR